MYIYMNCTGIWLTAGSALPRARGARDHDRRESDPVLDAVAALETPFISMA